MAQRAGTGGRPQDFTGQQKTKLAKEHADEQAQRAGEMALITAAEERAKETEVTDLTGQEPVILDQDEVIELDTVETREAPTRLIRALDDFSPTIGAGNHYEFEVGKKYRVPAAVATHLEEKGLVSLL